MKTPKQGMTLVEVLVAVSIFGALIAMIIPFFVASLDSYGVSVGKLYAVQDFRYFNQRLTKDAAPASALRITNAGNTLTLNYRDGRQVIYNLAGSGAIMRTEFAASGVQTSNAPIIERVITQPGSQLFTTVAVDPANTNIAISIETAGTLAVRAQSLRRPAIQNSFDFIVTRRS